jgi:hypothetical protein
VRSPVLMMIGQPRRSRLRSMDTGSLSIRLLSIKTYVVLTLMRYS